MTKIFGWIALAFAMLATSSAHAGLYELPQCAGGGVGYVFASGATFHCQAADKASPSFTVLLVGVGLSATAAIKMMTVTCTMNTPDAVPEGTWLGGRFDLAWAVGGHAGLFYRSGPTGGICRIAGPEAGMGFDITGSVMYIIRHAE